MPQTPGRTGSSMSNRQMAYAATRGRKATFQWLRLTTEDRPHRISGYVVGADDFHWLIAEPQLDHDGPEDHRVVTHLIAKGRCEIVTLSPEPTLEDEPPAIKVAVEELGRGFRSFCEKTYFGGSEEAEEPPTP